MFSISLVALVAALPQVLAHGGVLSYGIGGTTYQGWQPYNSPSGQTTIQRPWSSYNPIQGATTSTIACNDDGSSGAAQLTATVTAGQPITAYWNQIWPHAIGPQITYLAKCPGSTCTGVSASSLSWFKIDEAGLLSGNVYTGSWGAGLMIKQNSTWTSTIPASVPSGNYLIRFETIALHSLPAQFYPECAQLNIVGGGSVAPSGSELVKFPGAYSDSDSGLAINVYSSSAQTQTCYTIPGPPLYSGAKNTVSSLPACGGSSSPAPSSSSASSATTKPATSSSSSTAKSSPTGCVSNAYAQCGGTGFTGCTTCASGTTCKSSSAYYSQCL